MKPLPPAALDVILQKLRWGVGQPQQSTDFNARECEMLLDMIEGLDREVGEGK